MRLQPAIALDQYDEDRASGFGDREDRKARRAARRERRKGRREDRRENRQEKHDDRKARRADRKIERVERKKENVREKLSRAPAPPARGYERAPRSSAAPRSTEPTLQPAPTSMPDAKADPDEGWFDEAVDEVEEVVDEGEPLEDDAEATEGIGAWRPFERARDAVQRRPRAAQPPADPAWGPAVRMGRNLRIQAGRGHRAAVIDLKPGLYLVAELPEEVTRTEFGLAPLLAPLMINAARNAIDESNARPPEERRGLAALFRRRNEQGRPFRLFRARARSDEPAPVAAPAAPAPLALPGPVASDADDTFMVPAPNVGWADDRDVATVLGCEPCERRRR